MVLLMSLAFTAGYLTERVVDSIPHVKPIRHASQMVFLINDQATAAQGLVSLSQIIDRKADELGIERRRLSTDHSDLSNVEPWLAEMVAKHKADAPCIIWRSESGHIDCTPIPGSIDDMVALLEKRGAK